jgi:hypothetical protein
MWSNSWSSGSRVFSREISWSRIIDLSWAFFNFATNWKSNIAICFSHFWRLKTSKKIAFTNFWYSISLSHVASKKKGWVVDAHPLLIRYYLTTSNHNVNTWGRDKWLFFGRKIVKWRILFSKWQKLGVFLVFKSPNFDRKLEESNKILQMVD